MAAAERPWLTVIHVHGNTGNFYENEFIPVMAVEYQRAGINFLAANNRGHDGISEAYRHGRLVYVGAAYEDLSECVIDLEAAVAFAASLGQDVVLQAHSFGCLKALIYLAEKRDLDCILLSPADVWRLQSEYIEPEAIESQLIRIRETYGANSLSLLPETEFGVRRRGVSYHIPISGRTLLSYFSNPGLSMLRYERSVDFSLPIRCFVYCGGRDVLLTMPLDDIRSFWQRRVLDLRFLQIAEGDHHFHGYELLVAQEVVRWLISIRRESR